MSTSSDRATVANNEKNILVGTAEELINDKNSSETASIDKKSQKPEIVEAGNHKPEFSGHVPTLADSKSSKNSKNVKPEDRLKKTDSPVYCRKNDLNGVQISKKDIKSVSVNKILTNDENRVKESLKNNDKTKKTLLVYKIST